MTKKKPKQHSEREVMVHISSGVWLHGINVKKGSKTDFNPCRLIVDLDGGSEKIFTVDEWLEQEEE